MITAVRHLAQFLAARMESDRGATAVEYGLMVALIAVVIIAAVAALGDTLTESFTATNSAIQAELPAPVATP